MASEDSATEAQIKRLYAVLHSIGADPKQWKKDKNIASYAKLTRAQCSGHIDEAEAIEAEQKAGSSQPAAAPVATTIPTPPVAIPDDPEFLEVRAQVIEAELIKKYTNLLANVTEAVFAEDRIPDRE